PARRPGVYEPRDRRPAVYQPAHRRVPPAQGVPEARYQLTQRAPEGAPSLGAGRGARLMGLTAAHFHSCSEARCSAKRAIAPKYRKDPQLTRATPMAASSASDGACGTRATFTGPKTSEVKRRSASVSQRAIGYTQSAPASR